MDKHLNKKLILTIVAVLTTQLSQIVFAKETEITYQQFTQSLYKAQNYIAESNFRKLENILPELEDGNLLLFINTPQDNISAVNSEAAINYGFTKGISHGWQYYYIKQIILNDKKDYLAALDAGENALLLLEASKLPAKQTSELPYTEIELKKFSDNKKYAKMLSYIMCAKSALNFKQNIYAENHLQYVIADSNNAPEEIYCSAIGELTDLYLKQGKFHAAYNVTTQAISRLKYIPKRIMYQKANSAFWISENKEGFDSLLSELFSDDLDKEKPWEDPALILFLKRIALADESDVVALYDALDYQMGKVPITTENKPIILFYNNERSLLRRVCKFLSDENDMEKLRQRYLLEYKENQEIQNKMKNTEKKGE